MHKSLDNARLTLSFSHHDESTGDEITSELPAKYAVCGRCKGHGMHLRSAIGEYGYTREEFFESFPEEEDRAEYFKRGGIYDVTCERCGGLRVVAIVDEEACRTPEERALLAIYHRKLADDAAYERECAAERRAGA